MNDQLTRHESWAVGNGLWRNGMGMGMWTGRWMGTGKNGNCWRRIADETIFSDSRDFSVWRVSKLIFSAQSKKWFLHDERSGGVGLEMEMGKLHGVNDSQPMVWSPLATRHFSLTQLAQ